MPVNLHYVLLNENEENVIDDGESTPTIKFYLEPSLSL